MQYALYHAHHHDGHKQTQDGHLGPEEVQGQEGEQADGNLGLGGNAFMKCSVCHEKSVVFV